jgi:hypothetical protein
VGSTRVTHLDNDIINNYALVHGGGCFLEDQVGDVILSGTKLKGNIAVDGDGGGFYSSNDATNLVFLDDATNDAVAVVESAHPYQVPPVSHLSYPLFVLPDPRAN